LQKLVIVTGVPGVGKTSVSEDAVKGTDYRIVNFGDVMTPIVQEKKKEIEKDTIRKDLGQKDWAEFQRLTAEKINSLDYAVLLTTHACFLGKDGYFPGLPYATVLSRFDPPPTHIILIRATPEEIFPRRSKDTSRVRGYDFELNIGKHQDESENYCRIYSALTGAKFKIIDNPETHMNEAAEELRKILQGK
jgi:adenylate kinase